jgi:hypothetical protein
MRLETSERPSSWWLPWGHSSNFETGRTTHTSRGCFKCNQTRHWAKTSLHLTRHQDPVPLWPEWTLEDDCPSLSLQGRSVSHSHSQKSKGFTDLLGLAAEDWHGPGTLAPFKSILEEPRVTIQVAGKPHTYLVLPDFSGKLYPSQTSMVGVDSLIHHSKKKDSFV